MICKELTLEIGKCIFEGFRDILAWIGLLFTIVAFIANHVDNKEVN